MTAPPLPPADEYSGSSRPIVISSGLSGLPIGREVNEEDVHDLHDWQPPRHLVERLARRLAEENDVYTSVVRLAPPRCTDAATGASSQATCRKRASLDRSTTWQKRSGTSTTPGPTGWTGSGWLRGANPADPDHGVAGRGVRTQTIVP